MSVFFVRYTHPDVPGWREHLEAHTKWLLARLAEGTLKASGPLIGTPQGERGALLVFVAENRAGLDEIIATDPYSIHDLVSAMEVFEWNPFFGAFQPESSLPATLQQLDWAPLLARLSSAGGLGGPPG